jgi:hypothetical protein
VTYQLNTPWNNETWVDNTFTPYARLAGKPITGGTPNGVIAPRLTDIARGITLLVNGSVVTENRTPSQDDLSDADAYYLGGHEYTISDSEAAILIAAGYSDYLTPVV